MNNGDMTILLVGDNGGEPERKSLESQGYRVVYCGGSPKAIEEINRGLECELLIIDAALFDGNGNNVVEAFRLKNPEAKVVSYSSCPFSPQYSDFHIQKSSDLPRIVNAHFNSLNQI